MAVAGASASRALIRSRSSLYVCRSCRYQLSRPGVSLQQQRHASNEDLPTTEKVRRKLWGTDNPPGLKDPYGGPSFLEKRRARKQAVQADEVSEQTTEIQQKNSSQRAIQQAEADNLAPAPAPYVPSETWEGLQFVGSNGDWHNLVPQPTDEFSTWLDSTSAPAMNREDLVSCLHQALIECFTCHEAKLNVEAPLRLDTHSFKDNAIQAYTSAEFGASEQGIITDVLFAKGTDFDKVVEMLQNPNVNRIDENTKVEGSEATADSESLDGYQTDGEAAGDDINIFHPSTPATTIPQTSALYYTPENTSFLNGRLNAEQPITFLILKRFSQLSGHRIPDPILNNMFASEKPLSYLINSLLGMVVQPKPTKVADILMNKPGLNSQANVMIFPRRETPVDKQKEIGRWKIIEKELQNRGLPVFGMVKPL